MIKMALTQKVIVEAQYILGPKINSVFSRFINKPAISQTTGMPLVELQCLEEYFNTCKSNHATLTNLTDLNQKYDYFKSSFYQNVEKFFIENKNQFN